MRGLPLFMSPAAVFILLPGPSYAHQPVFSLGPETIWQGGVGIESGYEFESAGDDTGAAMDYELIYGVTPDLSLSMHVPQVIEEEHGGESSSGLGDVMLRGKHQVYRKDSLGAQDKLTSILGLKLPTGDEDADPPLGTGALDWLFGLSYGHESRTWYGFATLRYLLRTEHEDFLPGDVFYYDLAAGYRPWQRGYMEWDLVALLEMSGTREFHAEFDGREIPDSGASTIWLGPTGLLSYRQFMFKGRVQAPVYQELRGEQEDDDYRMVWALEYHF